MLNQKGKVIQKVKLETHKFWFLKMKELVYLLHPRLRRIMKEITFWEEMQNAKDRRKLKKITIMFLILEKIIKKHQIWYLILGILKSSILISNIKINSNNNNTNKYNNNNNNHHNKSNNNNNSNHNSNHLYQ